MGLSDVLNGMKNGPGGGASSTSSSGGMSPLTMGLLAFLAYKALKGSGVLGSEPPAGPASIAPRLRIARFRSGSERIRLVDGLAKGDRRRRRRRHLERRAQRTPQEGFSRPARVKPRSHGSAPAPINP